MLSGMVDEPRFPPPDEAMSQGASPYRPASASSPREDAAPRRVVITRADPPKDEPGAPKLTREEMRALLAVEGTNRSSALGRVWKRGRMIVLPTGLLGAVVHWVLGVAEPWASLAVLAIAVSWVARPLLRRDDWS